MESVQRSININHDPQSGKVSSFGRNVSESREPIVHPHEFLTMQDVIFLNPHNCFCRLDKALLSDKKIQDQFKLPQMQKLGGYATKQNSINYEYSPEGGSEDE